MKTLVGIERPTGSNPIINKYDQRKTASTGRCPPDKAQIDVSRRQRAGRRDSVLPKLHNSAGTAWRHPSNLLRRTAHREAHRIGDAQYVMWPGMSPTYKGLRRGRLHSYNRSRSVSGGLVAGKVADSVRDRKHTGLRPLLIASAPSCSLRPLISQSHPPDHRHTSPAALPRTRYFYREEFWCNSSPERCAPSA